jgi:membrane fusion protein, multidrug efflux system
MVRFISFSACFSVIFFLTGCQKTETHSSKPLQVAVYKIADSQAEPSLRYTGQVRPRYEISAAFRVGGKVTKRFVEIGQQVTAGTILAQLDTVDYQLNVEAAESELNAAIASAKRAIADEQRTRDLIAKAMISQAEYDLALATADSANASVERAERLVEIAKNRLKYSSLVAEYDCIVTRVLCEEGSVVQEGASVFQLARTEELEAVFDVPENRIEEVQKLVGKVTLWANTEQVFDARLREIAPTADPVTRTYQLKYTILNPTGQVHIGMTASIALRSSSSDSGIAVPLSSLVDNNGTPAVWIVDPNTGSLSLREVQVKRYGQSQAWVDNHFQPGELVVRAGVQKLDPSMIVSVWEDRIANSN